MRRLPHSRWWLLPALVACLSGGATPQPAAPAVALQPLIDATPEGGVLTLAPGRYLGPARIDRPMTVDGQGAATIDGRGHGSVLTLTAPGVTLTGLHLTGSGGSYDGIDSAIEVESDDNRIVRNVIDDSLFGVNVQGGSRNVICGNRISSKPEEPGLRGDAVRVWNGHHNRVLGNDIFLARDISLANSADTEVSGNLVRQGRMGLNLLFAPRTLISGNWLDRNLIGVAVLYSNQVVLRGNRIQHSFGVTGTGVAFKESSGCLMERNAVVHCAVGIKINAPNDPQNFVTFRQNRFAHNVTAMDFYGENGGHVIHGNRFEKNLSQVTTSAAMSARNHDWQGNAWDDYLGFDRDGDGVGDVPHEIYSFADRIWMEEPQAMFFRNSPALELLDFLERLAPFASPELTLVDSRPVVRDAAVAFDGELLAQPPPVPRCPPGGTATAP